MVSTSGGNEPVWSQSSRELFYRNMQGDMVTVPVEVEPTIAPGQPEVLLSAAGLRRSSTGRRSYDVTPDDQRFIMIRQTGDAGPTVQLIWVQNFFEELKARVPNYVDPITRRNAALQDRQRIEEGDFLKHHEHEVTLAWRIC